MLAEDEDPSLCAIAQQEKMDKGYVSRMVSLLAPDVVAALLGDQLPECISLSDLAVDVPVASGEQR